MHIVHFFGALLAVANLAGLTDPEMEKALHGDVPTRSETFQTQSGKSAGRGLGAIIVERPIADVWTTVARYRDKAEYVPRLTSVVILDEKPDRIHARMTVDASITTARYTAWFALDPTQHTVHWSIDREAKDNTIADVDGDYHLYELSPARTLVVYRTYIDSGRSVPRFVQNYLMRHSLPLTLKALKQRVESGGVWKK